MRKFVSLFLAGVMILSMSANAFAVEGNDQDVQEQQVIVLDEGVCINGAYYTRDQFVALLETAQEIEVPQTRVAGAAAGVVAGTWWIPGIGQVIVTAAGTILVAGAVIAVGSWIYNAVIEWFEERAFNESAKNALDDVNENKQNHILNNNLHKNGHDWKTIFNGKDPNWNQLKPILLKVLQEGTERAYNGSGTVFERELFYNGATVVVRFVKAVDGTVRYFGTAYLK